MKLPAAVWWGEDIVPEKGRKFDQKNSQIFGWNEWAKELRKSVKRRIKRGVQV